MMTRYEEKYTLYVYKDRLKKWVKYCQFTTLKRLQEQIEKYREDAKKPYYMRDGWGIWKGNEPININEYEIKIVHTIYKITKEIMSEEEV